MELQIKMRYHHCLEWPKSKPLTIPNACEDMEAQGHSFIAGGNGNEVAILQDSLQFITKVNTVLPYNSAIPFIVQYKHV